MIKRDRKISGISYEMVYVRALQLFDNDPERTNVWWLKKSSELKGLAPYEMVRNGKGRKLLRILERCGA
jgi:hypothetical protein